MKKAKDIVKDLIEINTQIPEGNESIAVKYIYDLLKDKASKIEIIGEYPRENIIAFFGNLESKNILLLTGHLDVAPADKEEWDTNPYIAEEKEGKIYGRGSCDMKGGIAICLEAILNSLNKDFVKDKLIIFAGTADEETGANSEIGAKLVANYLKENNIKPIGVILPEPNNHYEIIKVNIGHRGAMWVECESKGKAMHPGSIVHKENNAIINMYNFIEEVRNYIPGDTKIVDGIPGSTCRVTYINSGIKSAFKFVPDKCMCNLDIRVSPLEKNEEILSKLLEIANKHDVEVKVLRQTPSSIISKDEKILEIMLKVLEENKKAYEVCCASPVCDAHWFNALGMPTLNVLGASGGNVHVKNEYATIDSLEDRVKLLEEVIEKV